MSDRVKLTVQDLVREPDTVLFPQGYIDRVEPARAALDWQSYPIDAYFRENFTELNAIYLDDVFRRLYHSSETFNCLLKIREDVSKARVKVTDFTSYAPAFGITPAGNDTDITIMDRDSFNVRGLWMASYKLRELQQTNHYIQPGQTRPLDIAGALALNRARHADCSAFAATCVYETLTREGHPAHVIHQLFEKTAHHGSMEAMVDVSTAAPQALADGFASTKSFKAFLSPVNQPVLRALDRVFLEASQGKKEDAPSYRPLGRHDLAGLFNSLKTMPYLGDDGTPKGRAYLKEISFSDIDKLPRTGMANRLAIVRQWLPF